MHGRSAKRRKVEPVDIYSAIPPISSLLRPDIVDSRPTPEFDFYKLWRELFWIDNQCAANAATVSRLRSQDVPLDALDWTPWLSTDTAQHIGLGGYGDVYKGKWSRIPNCLGVVPQVAVKEMRIARLLPAGDRKRMKQLRREIEVWKDLQHENIVPFIGICHSRGMPALVSLWMENGSITYYTQTHPHADREKLLLEAALGLEYLHNVKIQIIHGDVKGANVLINDRGQSCLVDFGISRMVIDQTLWATTATHAGGTTRWQAPELMDGSQPTATAESDIYSWAMTCLEVMTGRPPYAECNNEVFVINKAAVRREIPQRPEGIAEHLWDLWTRCWKDANERPTIQDVICETFISANKDVLSDLCINQSVLTDLIGGDVATTINTLRGGTTPMGARLDHWLQLSPLSVLNLLISKGLVDVNAADASGEIPLTIAVEQNAADMIRSLLENGADVNAQNRHRDNALHKASLAGREPIVGLLLKNGADVNVKGGEYGSALQAACSTGNEPIVRLLLEHGANINEQCGRYGSAVQAASCCGHEAIVRLLRRKGVDHQVSKFDTTWLGVWMKHEELFLPLIPADADISMRPDKRSSLLQEACYRGDEVIVRMVLSDGVDVNARGGEHGYALQAASIGGHETIVRLLLEHGADVNTQNEGCGNALQCATSQGYEPIVRLLLEHGADPNAPGGSFGTAMQMATRSRYNSIVRLLVEYGADNTLRDKLPRVA